VSSNPASALCCTDRGTIAAGKRADIVIVDDTSGPLPAVVATVVNGRIRYLADGNRIAPAGGL
jgi:alpha-D-ribose 1-methylphosphonate 5-triphosphate diphosphatase